MNRERVRAGVSAAVFVMTLCTFAAAEGWGPIGRTAIVTTAAHVVSRDLQFPLSQYEQYVREGAELTTEELLAIYPDVDINPTRTIEEEIHLLQVVRTDRLDPYFAFRFGAIGQVVANAVAPMATASPQNRDAYFRDAEQYIRTAKMNPAARRPIDATYFPERTRQAATQDDTIEMDYRSALGFRGLGLASLSADASRCVNTVADVYYTIVISPASRLNVTDSDVRDFALQSLVYYLDSGNLAEADAAVDSILTLGVLTSEVEKRIGDVLFDAGYFQKAVERYESVLAHDPTQRDVAIRVSEYYMRLGDESSAQKFLEDAHAAYANAAKADALNDNAHRKLFTVERDIEARDARMESAKAALVAGQEKQSAAEKEKLDGNFVSALSQLRDAESLYSAITDEFPEPFKDAQRGLRTVQLEMKELRSNLVGSVQKLSGTGYAYSARRLGRTIPGVEKQAFEALQIIEFNTAMDELAASVGREIEALR